MNPDCKFNFFKDNSLALCCLLYKSTAVKKLIELIKNVYFSTDLPDGSVNAVIAATSFHWFCYKKNALPEIYRVLSPNGMLGVAWLFPDNESQPFLEEVTDYLIPYFSEKRQDFVIEEEKIISQLPLSGYFAQPKSTVFLSHTKCNREQFYQLVLSFGIVQAMPEEDFKNFVTFFNKVMSDFAVETGEEISSLTHRLSLHWCSRI